MMTQNYVNAPIHQHQYNMENQQIVQGQYKSFHRTHEPSKEANRLYREYKILSQELFIPDLVTRALSATRQTKSQVLANLKRCAELRKEFRDKFVEPDCQDVGHEIAIQWLSENARTIEETLQQESQRRWKTISPPSRLTIENNNSFKVLDSTQNDFIDIQENQDIHENDTSVNAGNIEIGALPTIKCKSASSIQHIHRTSNRSSKKSRKSKSKSPKTSQALVKDCIDVDFLDKERILNLFEWYYTLTVDTWMFVAELYEIEEKYLWLTATQVLGAVLYMMKKGNKSRETRTLTHILRNEMQNNRFLEHCYDHADTLEGYANKLYAENEEISDIVDELEEESLTNIAKLCFNDFLKVYKFLDPKAKPSLYDPSSYTVAELESLKTRASSSFEFIFTQDGEMMIIPNCECCAVTLDLNNTLV